MCLDFGKARAAEVKSAGDCVSSELSFSDDSRLLVECDDSLARLVFQRPSSSLKKPLLIDSKIAIFAGYGLKGDQRPEIVAVFSSKEVFIATQSGLLRKLPLDVKLLKPQTLLVIGEKNNAYSLYRHDFTYQNHAFALLSFHYKGGLGETYVVRDDGLFTRIDFQANLFDLATPNADTQKSGPVMAIENGVLNVGINGRPVSLDQFEIEARFQTQMMNTVLDSKQESVQPISYAEQRVPDLMTALQTGEIKPYPLLPSEEAMMLKAEEALLDPEAGSFVFTAPSGVGKSQLAYAFFDRIRRGLSKTISKTTKVFSLSRASIQQGSKYVGVLDTLISAIIESAKERPTLLFVDEIQSLMGAGTHEGNTVDVFGMLLEPLSTGRLKIVGTGTDYDYDHYIKSNPGLRRRIAEVRYEESSPSETLEKLRNWAAKNKPYRKQPSDEVLTFVRDLSEELDAENAQPAKARNLLALAYSKLEVREGFSDQRPITRQDVIAAAIDKYRIDQAFFDPALMKDRLDHLIAHLDETHAGLEDAKAVLKEWAEIRFSRSRSRQEVPISIGFVGPKGVGKTSLFREWAQALGYGKPTVIGMAKYANGNVDGFFRELGQALDRTAFAAVILDELDAAHPDVQMALQTAMSEGWFYSEVVANHASKQRVFRKMSLRNAVVTFTSNLGTGFLQKKLSSNKLGFAPQDELPGPVTFSMQLREALLHDQSPQGGHILPTLLDRFTSIIPFYYPTKEEFELALRQHLKRGLEIQSREQGAAVTIENENDFISDALEKAYNSTVSLRRAPEIVESFLSHAMKEARIKGDTGRGQALQLRYVADDFSQHVLVMSGCSNLLKRYAAADTQP